MPHDGYIEFICGQGHLWVLDHHDIENIVSEKQLTCPYCDEHAVFHCNVDESHGIDSNIPETLPGPKDMFAFQEVECKDFKGNIYYIKRDLFAPNLASKRWHVVEHQ